MKVKPLGWAQFHMTGVLIKRGNLDTHTHTLMYTQSENTM